MDQILFPAVTQLEFRKKIHLRRGKEADPEIQVAAGIFICP